MKLKKKKNDEELNFWQPAADMFSALMLILMLVILLLGLYLVQIPENREIDPYLGDADHGGWDGDYDPTPTPTVYWDNGGGWGGGHTPEPTASPSPTPTATPTPTPTPDHSGSGKGPGDAPDEGMKAAVYVMLVDAETDRTIKEPNVTFELYGENDALQILNTYYPERLTFRTYETTEAGTFYFPEKLPSGTYTLHELTEATGYDIAPNQEFVLDQIYDWPDPYVVRVPVYPSRNVIRIQMTDAETGMPVPGGSFEIIAKENVITDDGTLRYRVGQTVGEIVCDENGYGVSDEVYLGDYILRQRDIPEYYASYDQEIEVSVEKKASVQPILNSVPNERTKINLSLTDELYENRGIEGATFLVFTGNGSTEPLEIRTDSSGRFTLDSLNKGITYRIRQTESTGSYRPDRDDRTVNIRLDGRIDGEAETELSVTNRMLRVNIGITDEFSNVQIPGVNLALYNAYDELVRTWTTSGTTQQFTDLEEGSYYIIKDGETEEQYKITVRDTAEVQEINIHSTYILQYLMIGAGLILAIGLIILIIVMIRRRRKKRAS